MSIVSAILLVFTLLGTAYYILSTLALISHFRRKRQAQTHQPRVSILKPVSGVDSGARENFLTYLTQDYTDYEVIFGVLDHDDPSVAVINDTIQKFSHSSLHIGSRINGTNNKVRILHNLLSYSNGEIIVITDADTRVTPDFLSRIVSEFEDDHIGAVTCMYRGANAASIADSLEGLYMTCVFAPGVACAESLGGIDFGLGAAIAIRREVLEEIGGFEPIADYLADDYQLGKRTASSGYKVELSDYVVDIMLSGENLRSIITRELRWAKTTRVSNPRGHFGLKLTFGFAYAVLFLLTTGFSIFGWQVLIGATFVRLASSYIGAYKCLGDSEYLKRIYLFPIRDLLSPTIWIAAYFSNTIIWRGRKLHLKRDGRISPFK